MFSKLVLAAALALSAVALAKADVQSKPPLTDADLARLEREATARAQKVAVDGGPVALASEIARELATVGQYEDFYLVGDYAPAYKNFPGETVTAFKSVDVEIQYNLLLWSWRRFQFPAMAPVLKALYQSPPEDYSKMRDLALRRLFDLAPDEARPLMLDELQRNDLRLSTTTLGRLGQMTFPEFEPLWLRNLENGILDERLDAAVRIERFGSRAIRADVKRLYDAGANAWSCEVRRAIVAYLKEGTLGEDCESRNAPRPAMPAKASIVVGGPVPGDEQRIRYTAGDQVFESTEELIEWLQQLPPGATATLTYASNSAATHPERWTPEERARVISAIRASAKVAIEVRDR